MRTDDIEEIVRGANLRTEGTGGDVVRITSRMRVIRIRSFIGNGEEGLSLDHTGRHASGERLDLFANVKEKCIGAPSANNHDCVDGNII